MDMYTGLYFKWITNKDLLLNGTLLSLCGNLDGRGVWGRMYIYGRVSLLFIWNYHNKCLLTGYTPIQKNFLKKNKSPSSDLFFLLLITDPTLLAAMFAVHSFLPWDFSIWCWLKGFFPFCQPRPLEYQV